MFLTHQMTKSTPMAENVTVNGIKNCGLRVGDVIKSNDAAYFRVESFVFTENMIVVETIDGGHMRISGSNKIDLIC